MFNVENLAAVAHANDMVMSSREIADITGKRHDHVIRDIRNMLEALELDAPNFGATYRDASNREKPMFNLPKDLTLTLVTGYNVAMRHAIVQRWEELEREISPEPIVPLTYKEALVQLLAKEEVIEQQQAQIDSLNQYFTEGMTYSAFALTLNGVNSQRLGMFLKEKGWLRDNTEDNGGGRFRTTYKGRKYLSDKFGERPSHSEPGQVRLTNKIILLKKGAQEIYAMYTAGQLPMKADWDGSYTAMTFQ
ncbi:Rha family transcriptional regulator [Klebsiella aerogenes]|uniref:Rha family transcriptional regulator n=1 Tax=Klebsiella aerogenes TaxID=548 RepID=UPI002D7FC933|nr:Rha family transcriptional regulator [Klebsiella aerogenes]